MPANTLFKKHLVAKYKCSLNIFFSGSQTVSGSSAVVRRNSGYQNFSRSNFEEDLGPIPAADSRYLLEFFNYFRSLLKNKHSIFML